MNNNNIYNNLYNKIIKNGGFTINKELKELDKKNGFICSIIGKEKIFNLNDKENIIKTIKEYKKGLKFNEYIGAWVNNNKIYIDISKHYASKQKAILTGIKNKQLAIFDLKNKKDIELLKSVYIVYKLDKVKNDIIYLKEYNDITDIIKEYNLTNKKSVYNYIIDSFNDIADIKSILNDKYIIIKENIFINEL